MRQSEAEVRVPVSEQFSVFGVAIIVLPVNHAKELVDTFAYVIVSFSVLAMGSLLTPKQQHYK